jgi:hypothetical protein
VQPGNVAIAVYQVVLSNPKGGYIRMIGQSAIADKDKMLLEFAAIANSLQLAR